MPPIPETDASGPFARRRLALLLGAFLGGGLLWISTLGMAPPGDSEPTGEEVSSKMSDEQRRERIDSLYTKYQRKFPDVEGISAEELLQALDEDRELVLVDVRKPKEQEVSMIPGALTQEEFEQRADELEGKTVVTYCTAGYRSGLYAKKLRKKGWEVLNLEGSLLSWTHAGGPLVDAQGPTRRVHVYGKDWDLANSEYESVW